MGAVIDQAVEVCKELAGDSWEVLVINDGSTDGSLNQIEEKKSIHPEISVVDHPVNKGIGAALISGYTRAKGQRVCGVPADGQFNLNELLPFKTFKQGQVISFSRRNKRYNLYRAALSSFNTVTNRVFLGLELQDVNWVKIYHREDLRKLQLRMKSSLIESEMCAKLKALGVKFIETPSEYQVRRSGQSKGGGLKTVVIAATEFSFLIYHVNLFRFRNRTQLF